MAYDFGIKTNILRRLTSAGCKVTVVPAAYPAEKVLDMKPDGVFLSNGPVRGCPCRPPSPEWMDPDSSSLQFRVRNAVRTQPGA